MGFNILTLSGHLHVIDFIVCIYIRCLLISICQIELGESVRASLRFIKFLIAKLRHMGLM